MSRDDPSDRYSILNALDEVVRRLSRAAQRTAPTADDEECGGYWTPEGIRIEDGRFGSELALWIDQLARELARERFNWPGGELYCDGELIEEKVTGDFEWLADISFRGVVGIRVGDLVDRKCLDELGALRNVLSEKLATDHLYRQVNWRIQACVTDLKVRTRFVSDSLSQLCESSGDSRHSDEWMPPKRNAQQEEGIRRDFDCWQIVESVILDACEHQLDQRRTPNSVIPVLQRLVEGIRRMQSDTYQFREWVEDRAFDSIVDWWVERWKPVFESMIALLSDVSKTLPNEFCLDREPPDKAAFELDNAARNANSVAPVAPRGSVERVLVSHETLLDRAKLRALSRHERYTLLLEEAQQRTAPEIYAVLEELILHLQRCGPGQELRNCDGLLGRLKALAERARLPVPIAIDRDDAGAGTTAGLRINYPYGEESESWLLGARPGYLPQFYSDVLGPDGMRKWTSEDRADIIDLLRQWQRLMIRLSRSNDSPSNTPERCIVIHADKRVTVEGKTIKVGKLCKACLIKIVEGQGEWVSGKSMRGVKRPDRALAPFRKKFPWVIDSDRDGYLLNIPGRVEPQPSSSVNSRQ